MTQGVDDSQRKAAKVVGVAYLFAMATAIFAESLVRGRLISFDNVALTAQNIQAHQQLFRLGIGSDLLTFTTDVALIWALYVILAPVNRHLALLAAFFRMIETSVAAMMTVYSVDVLRILSGADYLGAFQADQVAALARLAIGAHGAAYNTAFVFLGLGSTVFGYLWLKSSYVPKALAVLGVVASALLGVGTFAGLVFPGVRSVLYPAYMVPMFFFEVGMGLWLLVRGLRPPAVGGPEFARPS